MNKNILVKKIIAALSEGMELYFRAATSARAEATDPQSKAENKYDTRGLEASYLARGQSRRIVEAENSIKELQKMAVRNFGPNDAIDGSAVVEVDNRGERTTYFIAPCAGGTEIKQGKIEIIVLTPESPLGQQLIGKKQGAKFKTEFAGAREEYHIVAVS